ncbi:unnamed protein product [Rotaria sp. Silwood2]|nr:unnamed protein product [Rotaria sp. Silwood2]CAF3537362.1 unnamed protein product [Rotaria sp. Silwood2]CAF4621504.1 unnamed protein product [Rotaria sp. Silwood2]CAF4784392.1 unnamed protein product [Rotaria sp. Silwood2]
MNEQHLSNTHTTASQDNNIILLNISRMQVNKILPDLFITQKLDDTSIERGKLLKLVIKTSKSSNEVAWFKYNALHNKCNRAKKLNNTKYKAYSYYTKYLNIVPQLSQSSNNISTSFDIKVFESELKFIEILPEQINLIENDQLTLLCETNRRPKMVQWFKDEFNISPELDKSLIIYNFDEIFVLIINDVNEFHSGVYTCYVEDSIKSTCIVQIEDPNLPSIDSSFPSKLHANEQIETIYCKINKVNISLK